MFSNRELIPVSARHHGRPDRPNSCPRLRFGRAGFQPRQKCGAARLPLGVLLAEPSVHFAQPFPAERQPGFVIFQFQFSLFRFSAVAFLIRYQQLEINVTHSKHSTEVISNPQTRRRLLALLLALFFSIASGARSQDTGYVAAARHSTECDEHADRAYAVCRGMWSGKTVALFNTWSAPDTNPDRRLDFASPDGKKIIQVHGFHARLRMNGKQYWTPFGAMHDAEVAWAPDSTRLFVTWSESGQLGPWHTQIYNVTENGLVDIPRVTRQVRPDLIQKMKKAPVPKWIAGPEQRFYWSGLDYCADDVVGSQWLNGSREILVAGLAGPDSGCKYMGDFVVYRIEVETGKILQAYSEKEAENIFGGEDLPRYEDDGSEL